MQSISQVTFDPSLGSDADRAELEAMRREVCCLTAELTRLQAAVRSNHTPALRCSDQEPVGPPMSSSGSFSHMSFSFFQSSRLG